MPASDQQGLDLFIAGLGQGAGALLFVQLEMPSGAELHHILVDRVVEVPNGHPADRR